MRHIAARRAPEPGLPTDRGLAVSSGRSAPGAHQGV